MSPFKSVNPFHHLRLLMLPAALAFAPCFVRANPAALSLEALINEVVAANPELAIYEEAIAAAQGERRQAGRWSNPEFSLEAGRQRVRGTGGAGSAEGLAWAASVAQPIEFPGRLALRKAIADANVDLARVGLEHFRQLLAHRVEVLAHQLHASRTFAEATDTVAERALELAQGVLQRETSGISPLLESRILESSQILLQQRRIAARLAHHNALIELNQLRDQPAETPVRIEIPAPQRPLLPPIRELVSLAWSDSFEARSRQIELEQQGIRVDLAENERYPTVTVAPFISQDNAGERETVAGVGLSFPLPLWDRNGGNMLAARARERQAEAALRVMRREIERRVVQASLAYEAASDELDALRPDVIDDLDRAAQLAERHYRLGALPINLYLETQTAYLDALEALLSMQQEVLESRLDLERAIGPFNSLEDLP